MNKLKIDDREPKEMGGLLDALDIPNKRERQDIGDFFWLDADELPVVVTRKASDLFQSLFSGHFSDELNRCATLINSLGGGKLIWLIEGPWSGTGVGSGHYKKRGSEWFKRFGSTGANITTYFHAQASAIAGGVAIVHTTSVKETAAMLAVLYNRSQEGWPSKLAHPLKLPPLQFMEDTRTVRLQGLWPRLPQRAAQTLLTEYGSVGKILEVAVRDPHEFKRLKGIGSTLVQNLIEVIE